MTTRKPVTITIDSEQDKKLRTIQAKLISSTSSSWSYSQVIKIILDEGLEKFSISKAKKK